MAWKTQTKPIKSNQPDRPKHLESSPHANLQLPRLCLIYISTQDSYMAEKNKTKSKAKPSKQFKIQWIYYFVFLFYFCELSLPASFQLPKLCLIHMSTPDSAMAEKKQTNQIKPKTNPTKPSKTTWIILLVSLSPTPAQTQLNSI